MSSDKELLWPQCAVAVLCILPLLGLIPVLVELSDNAILLVRWCGDRLLPYEWDQDSSPGPPGRGIGNASPPG